MERTNINTFPELMSVEEAAKYLYKGKNFVYDAVKTGEIPSIRLGKSIRIVRAGLSNWLENQVTKAQQSIAN